MNVSVDAVHVRTDLPAQHNNRVSALKVETIADEIKAGTGGLAIASDGTIFTSDFGSRLGGGGTGGDKIYKISADGKVALFCNGQLGASGSTFDKNGRLFQANIRGNRINVISPAGKVTEFARKGLNFPVGLVLNNDGSLFVCNCGGSSIQKITAAGESSIFVQDMLLQCPNGIAKGDDGCLYISNFMNGDVVKVTPEGKASRLATIPGGNNGHIVMHRGQLFVVARSAHKIYRVSLDGKTEVFAGSGKRGKQDGAPNEATFSFPNGIAISPDGKYMYVNEVSEVKGSGMNLAPTRVRRILLGE